MRTTLLLLLLSVSFNLSSQISEIRGVITNANNDPIDFANVYVEGTLEGTTPDTDGRFYLKITAKDTITLIVSSIGFKTYKKTDHINYFNDIIIVLHSDETILDDVVILAGNYNVLSASTLEGRSAVDLVTTAGAEGDLYKSISLLPGIQASGTDGRLIVRGGTTRETQTYIDDMHVLSPYTASSNNFSSRGRYSPFLFEGINFSMGGYSSEYSQSLSAILPLETKNVSDISKLGVDIMNVSIGGGGTQAWDKGSTSFNVNYTDLNLYNKVFYPSIEDSWNKPYRQLGFQNQFRFELDENTYLKTYFTYDKTTFNLVELDLPDFTPRDLNYEEDNIYVNSTFRKKNSRGLHFFAGVAYSLNHKNINNGLMVGDSVNDKEHELHFKIKAGKRFSNLYKLETGAEGLLKDKDLEYRYYESQKADYNNNLYGLFVSNDLNLTNTLFLNISGRVEYTEMNTSLAFLPRMALGYRWNKINFSSVFGLYQQSAHDDYLRYNHDLNQERNFQSLFGMYYQEDSRIFRIEGYNKKYSNLVYFRDEEYVSNGSGYSRGIDLFFSDYEFKKYWNYMFAYSYNDTKRNINNFPEKVTPNYATKHNLSFTLKYTNYDIKSVIGLTNRTASGRKYHDPNKQGYMNSTTPIYNSLDLSYTFLAHRNLIVYASWSNILNRENIFSYEYARDANGVYVERPLKLQQNRAFYIGFFITLGKNIAYDVSNF